MVQSRQKVLGSKQLWKIHQSIPPNIIKSIRQYERINKKICRQKMSIMFNEICINEEMLPIYYIYIYIIYCIKCTFYDIYVIYIIYICVRVYIYIYIYIYVCNFFLDYISRNTQINIASQYDWSLITNCDIRNYYLVTVRNKFGTL